MYVIGVFGGNNFTLAISHSKCIRTYKHKHSLRCTYKFAETVYVWLSEINLKNLICEIYFDFSLLFYYYAFFNSGVYLIPQDVEIGFFFIITIEIREAFTQKREIFYSNIVVLWINRCIPDLFRKICREFINRLIFYNRS